MKFVRLTESDDKNIKGVTDWNKGKNKSRNRISGKNNLLLDFNVTVIIDSLLNYPS
jgi:hypothetical protein